jgi:hypothetical protein
MVARIICACLSFLLLIAFTGPITALADYPRPVKWAAPAGPAMVPASPYAAPLMVGPGPAANASNVMPPCPPPPYRLPAGCSFNPLSAVVSVLTLPFRLLGSAVTGLGRHRAQPCVPVQYMPMPQCLPPCPQPMAKCRPVGMPTAAYGNAPMTQFPKQY